MDSLFDMAIYPFIALFLAGILFIHLGLRSKASQPARFSFDRLSCGMAELGSHRLPFLYWPRRS